ncbi:BRO-N domain-containing protein [Rhodobacter maris]|uniref:BRO family protein n=1 Tax=Rhodobacter maris TaxID=446682 RepID=A0A285S5C0_9RHOB|nr:BRO family protein [Rhodobacter maris]SOC00104.1 BRO family protein [Rhodobacter maris]
MENLPAVAVANTRFGKLRSVTIDGQVWFVAADVCKALGLTNTGKALSNISASYVGEIRLSNRGGRPHKLVNEFGLNDLVLDSRKPTARAFRRLLTSEVIPSIMKHGVYVVGQGTMTDDQLRAAVGERSERLIEGTRAERRARIAADVERFKQLNGRYPNAKERFFVEKP